MKLSEIEDLNLKRSGSPFPRPAQPTISERIQRCLAESNTVVMGPNPLPPTLRCYIYHSDGRCSCTPIDVKRPSMVETCEAASMHVLGSMKKQAVPGKLSREDLDYLTWRVSMIAAHWGRLALGMEELV